MNYFFNKTSILGILLQNTIIFILISLISYQVSVAKVDNSFGSLPPFTKWYQNPLGVSPIALHTGNGIILPAIAAGTILLLTSKDSTLIEKLSIYDEIGYTEGYYGSFSTLFHNNIGINYMLRNYLSVGTEITQVYIKDEINQVFGIGVRPFIRFYPINNENFKIYFMSGAGLIYFFENFPKPSGFFGDMREGTQLNGCPKYGLGIEIKLSKELNIYGNWNHIHFSNGNNPNEDRNPGHDSNGLSLGVVYKFK